MTDNRHCAGTDKPSGPDNRSDRQPDNPSGPDNGLRIQVMNRRRREGPTGGPGRRETGFDVVAQGHQRVHLRHDAVLFGEGGMGTLMRRSLAALIPVAVMPVARFASSAANQGESSSTTRKAPEKPA